MERSVTYILAFKDDSVSFKASASVFSGTPNDGFGETVDFDDVCAVEIDADDELLNVTCYAQDGYFVDEDNTSFEWVDSQGEYELIVTLASDVF